MSISHAMERIARIVAADQQLKVRVRGALAYATPGEVTIPAIENFSHLGAYAERMLHGLLDHECGHALDSDFALVEKAAAQSPAFKALLNAIEDGYVEGRQGLRYRGCVDNLEQKNRWYWEVPHDGKTVASRIQSEDDWTAFLLAVAVVVRPHGGRTIEDIAPVNPKVHAMLEQVRADLEEVATLYELPKATARCYEIAERIYKRFAKEAEEESGSSEEQSDGEQQEDQQEQEDSKDSSEGAESNAASPEEQTSTETEEPSEESDQGSEESEETPDDDSEQESSAGDDDQGAEEAEPDPEPESAQEQGQDGEQDEQDKTAKLPERIKVDLERWENPGTPLDPEQAVQVEIEKVFDQPASVAPYLVYSHDWDVERDFSENPESARRAKNYSIIEAETRTAAEALISAFEVGLRAKRERRPVPYHDEGEIDVPALLEYSVGAISPDQIFCDRVAEDDRCAAVAVLVDCSGSMSGPRAELALRTAIALHSALDAVQIPHEVTGFTTIGPFDTESCHPWAAGMNAELTARRLDIKREVEVARGKGVDLEKFTRSIPEETPFHAVFKSFSSDAAEGLLNIAGIGNNLDGEAVLWQAARLARRPESRRVMFVLSDGYPAGSIDNAQGRRHLAESVSRAIDAGIEVYGIGIQSKAVAEFYPQHWICSSLQELTELAFSAVSEVLVNNRQERECVTL
jgi:cobalamin biosynthesis protein CobT